MRTPLIAATALCLLATPALATSNPLAVKFTDLDLDTAAGKATLDARIDNAARRYCADEQVTGSRIGSQSCLKSVRSEVLAKIDEYQDRVGKGG